MRSETQLIEAAIKPSASRRTRCLAGMRLALAPFDYALLALLSLLLVPAFILARLPFRLEIHRFVDFYWGVFSVRSAFAAILLAILGFPLRQMLLPVLQRYWKQKARIFIALAAAVELFYIFGFLFGFVLTVVALALAELMDWKRQAFESTLLDLFWPGLYLFCGIILVFALNTAMVGIRYFGTYDQLLVNLDRTLFHVNVANLSHWTLAHSPRWLAMLFDYSYFGLFSQIGATLWLGAILKGQRYANRHVRAMIVAYTAALLTYFALPAKGPYFTDPRLLTGRAPHLIAWSAQASLLQEAWMLWSHALPPGAATIGGYFISFPCMHIALALISLWFLRPWNRIFRIVLAYDVLLLIPSIILLEWHYLTDMLGGIAVAYLAVWISQRVERSAAPSEASREAQMTPAAAAP